LAWLQVVTVRHDDALEMPYFIAKFAGSFCTTSLPKCHAGLHEWFVNKKTIHPTHLLLTWHHANQATTGESNAALGNAHT